MSTATSPLADLAALVNSLSGLLAAAGTLLVAIARFMRWKKSGWHLSEAEPLESSRESLESGKAPKQMDKKETPLV